MAEYKTPGVYVEEISTFPATVVRVATAVPVFIGYTEICPPEHQNKPVKIKTLMEYQQIFGGEPTTAGRTIEVSLDSSNAPTTVSLDLNFYLHQCLRHFYANGGGDAYILSIDDYATAPGSDATRASAIIAALSPLEEADEPTLILTPDAFAFTSGGSLGDVQAAVLAHCAKMQDRFGILDVQMGVDVLTAATDFRTEVGNQNLKYGAAYFPVLETTLGPDGEIAIESFDLFDALNVATTLEAIAPTSGDPNLVSYYEIQRDKALLADPAPTVYGVPATWASLIADWAAAYGNGDPLPTSGDPLATRDVTAVDLITDLITILGRMGQVLYSYKTLNFFENNVIDGVKEAFLVQTNATGLLAKIQTLFILHQTFDNATVTSSTPPVLTIMVNTDFGTPLYDYDLAGITLPAINPYDLGGTVAEISVAANNVLSTLEGIYDDLVNYYDSLQAAATTELAAIGDLRNTSSIVSSIVAAIRNTGYTLPPCGAVAGVYAAVDASRGVWKAPANVSLNAVTSVIKMAEDELNDLNIPDDGQGKSINAIRLFRGQGILVYGARTLAGNDNEWRYVPVRRLFNMVEESVKKATEPFVFESNNASTWLNVKSMIENFLTGLWRDGALAGAVPQDAFFVKVGLGQTMTAQDILEGKMIIEIGMAAVRPAEFVILKFSHKLQES